MASKNELIERGNALAAKYNVDELKDALKIAVAMNDNEERLALQWALKQKTQTTNGYAFTKEVAAKLNEKLAV